MKADKVLVAVRGRRILVLRHKGTHVSEASRRHILQIAPRREYADTHDWVVWPVCALRCHLLQPADLCNHRVTTALPAAVEGVDITETAGCVDGRLVLDQRGARHHQSRPLSQ